MPESLPILDSGTSGPRLREHVYRLNKRIATASGIWLVSPPRPQDDADRLFLVEPTKRQSDRHHAQCEDALPPRLGPTGRPAYAQVVAVAQAIRRAYPRTIMINAG